MRPKGKPFSASLPSSIDFIKLTDSLSARLVIIGPMRKDGLMHASEKPSLPSANSQAFFSARYLDSLYAPFCSVLSVFQSDSSKTLLLSALSGFVIQSMPGPTAAMDDVTTQRLTPILIEAEMTFVVPCRAGSTRSLWGSSTTFLNGDAVCIT